MKYTYVITDNLVINIYDTQNNELVDYPGPYQNIESATIVAENLISALNNSEIPDPRIKGDE